MISLQLPAARTRLLIGSDNVDLWGEKRIWDAALKDVQIVVSTYAVLADALGHGYMSMGKLALLVFDEGRLTNSYAHIFSDPVRSHEKFIIVRGGIQQTKL